MERWQDPEWVKTMNIRLDYSRMTADFIGLEHGITNDEIDSLVPRATQVAGDINKRRKSGEYGFYQLPYDLVTAGNVVETAKALRKNCDNLVLIGIGGSALGAAALFRSLCHPLHNLLTKKERVGIPRFFVIDNVDPATCRAVFNQIDPMKTIFNIVTKAGTTTETVSQFLIARQLISGTLGKKAVKDHIVVTTDNRPNPLRKIAEAAGYTILDIPENVGGRFSVFSPVGIFPAAVLGIDIEELLAGAWLADKRCRTAELRRNPAYMAGALHYLADTRKGLHITAMMPYSDALYQIAFWFRQLWAESLGKSLDRDGNFVHSGQTPVAALGATDQHSQLQLYMEGPFNKMITFLIVENHNTELKIPAVVEDDFSYLKKRELGDLLNIEAQSTQMGLARAGRSYLRLILPEVNPFTIGQLLFMLEVQTVFTGGLYNINPLDQPGVVASKEYIYGLLGHENYRGKAEEIRAQQKQNGLYVI